MSRQKIASKILCIIQARSGSTRLPGKVLKKVQGKTLLEHEIRRVRLARAIGRIVVATTKKKEDDRIARLCRKLAIDCFRGSENDVLDRYYSCTLNYPKYDTIVRITGDCPLIDPKVIGRVIALFTKSRCDYASNVMPETFPDGMDVEVFRRSVLTETHKHAWLNSEREHVTLYVRNRSRYSKRNLRASADYSVYRLTVDNPEDFKVVKFLLEHSRLGEGYRRLVGLLKQHPDISNLNFHIRRNEGLLKSLNNDFVIK